jgi:hypothetical protein
MNEHESDGPDQSADMDRSEGTLKDPHLLDLNNLPEVAQWIALAAAGGVIGGAAYDLVRMIFQRRGRDAVRELRERVLADSKKARKEIDEQTAEEIRKLFEDFA